MTKPKEHKSKNNPKPPSAGKYDDAPAVGVFGEPYSVRRFAEGFIVIRGGVAIPEVMDRETANRVVGCVNALAGIDDPEAFVKKAKYSIDLIQKMVDHKVKL